MSEPTTPIHLTRLEIVASACATAAVADSAPPGSPGEPILTANKKFNAGLKSPSPASLHKDGGGRLEVELCEAITDLLDVIGDEERPACQVAVEVLKKAGWDRG